MESDYPMEMDDLFGDTEQVNISTMAMHPLKGLDQRLDELYSTGCCQKVSWSKAGCVAYIASDGNTVNLRAFKRDPSTGRWELGKDTPLNIPHSQDGFPIIHLSWSHLGTDLAVIDSAGRLMIFAIAIVVDRMVLSRAYISDHEDEMDAVVGMHWLSISPHEKRNQIAWSASGKDDKWSFQVALHVFHDAHHPADGKASLIYVTKNRQIKFRFQQYDSAWHEISTDLTSMTSLRDTLTHASFASNNDNTLLLATYDLAGRIDLYRITTRWNIPPPKQGQPPKPFPPPSLEVISLAFQENCLPMAVPSIDQEPNHPTEAKLRLNAHITHFNFLPSTPEQGGRPEQGARTVPTIHAVFATPPTVSSLDQSQSHHSRCSVVARWEFEEKQANILHSSLDKVTLKKKSVASVQQRPKYLLNRKEDYPMNSTILSVFPLWYNMVLAYCYSDGTIEFRSRASMDVITPDYNTETVTSLPQAGFAFPAVDPALHIALSPNYCMAVAMQHDGTIKLKSMEYTHGSLNTSEKEPRTDAAIAALVLQSTSATNQYFSTDDIYAMIGDLSEERREQFVALLLSAVNTNLDCGVDEPNQNYLMLLGRSPALAKALSAAHLIGLKGSIDRTLPSKICWIILNIKFITQILTTIARMHGPVDKSFLRPEIVPHLIGICRWAVQFMVYIIDGLFTLERELHNIPQTSFDRHTLESKLQKLNNPVISILLSGFPRTLMSLWKQPLDWIERSCKLYQNPQTPLETRRAFSPLYQAINEVPTVRPAFYNLISNTQAEVRDSLKRAGMNEAQRNEVERRLLLGKIPEVLVPAAHTLLTKILFHERNGHPAVASQVDVDKIIHFDTTWLGLTASNSARAWFNSHVVDVAQKMIIRGTGTQFHASSRVASGSTGGGKKKSRPPLRKCTRCGAYMEDVMPGALGYSIQHVNWLMSVAKHCVCSNYWVLAEEKKDAV